MIKLFNLILPLMALQLVVARTHAAPTSSAKPTQNATETKGDVEAASQKRSELPERKSVFEDMIRPPYTDPFYPNTKRRLYAQQASTEVAPQENPSAVVLDQIVLKGISGPVGRRLALINNYTFAAGESGVVRLPKGSAKIEVLEVKERSAVIRIEKDPEPKEIFLRPEP